MSPNKHTYYLSEETAAKLIREVKCRSCLWDPDDENYTSRYFTAKSWREVAENIGIKESILRAKWKNLRDLFKKDVKKFKTTSLSNYKGRWRYFRPLWFLYKICDNDFEDQSQSNGEEQQNGDEDNLSNVEYLEESDQGDCSEDTLGLAHVFKVETDTNDGLIEDPIGEKASYTDDDYDLMFLKSLLPYFRQLDSMRKLVLRSKLQDMLMNEIAAQNSANRFNSIRK